MQYPQLTGLQIRAARASLGWSVRVLAELSGIGTATIVRYEAEDSVPASRKGHLATLKDIFEGNGIEFIGTPDDRPGIRVDTPRR